MLGIIGFKLYSGSQKQKFEGLNSVRVQEFESVISTYVLVHRRIFSKILVVLRLIVLSMMLL